MTYAVLYAGVFLQALILALVLTPLAGRWGRRWGVMDAPGERKIHTEVIPRSGGVAIFAAFAGTLALDSVLFFLLIGSESEGPLAPYRRNLAGVAPRLIALLAGVSIVFAVGLYDDRYSLGPRVKLFFQFLSTLPLLAGGIRIDFFLQELLPPGMAWIAGSALTVGWVLLLTNSLNFLDNMDGLTGGICLTVCLVLSGFSVMSGHVFMTACYLALAGAALGFLRYNWRPAKLFMGDSGSLTIGWSLAALTINSRFWFAGAETGLPALIPVVALGVPIFDTVTVMLIRLRRRAPLMKGDTNHISHRLVALGFSQVQAVVFICLLTLVTGLMALPLRYLPPAPAVLHIVGIVALFGLIFIMERVAQRKMRGASETENS